VPSHLRGTFLAKVDYDTGPVPSEAVDATFAIR